MGDLKAIGSEKLKGQDKINRIMEIARYGESKKNTTNHITTNHFSKRAKNGTLYAIIKEKDGYYVKAGLNESKLDYVDGLANKTKNRFRSYSSALKRINLILKPINEEYNRGRGDSLYEQAEEKFVLKQQGAPAPAAVPPAPAAVPPAPPAPPAPGGLPPADMEGMEDMEAAYDDMGDEEMDMDVDIEGGEEGFDELEQTPTIKSIQKLTGKLGQKMREYEDDMDSDMIKYVLNSVIAAVDLDELDDEDRDDIVSRLEPDLEDEYGMEDDFEADVDMDMDMDMGVEDDMEGDMGMDEVQLDAEGNPIGMDIEEPGMPGGLEESLKLKVNKTLKSYFKLTEKEMGRKLFNEAKNRHYIKESIKNKKIQNSHNAINLCETIEQELKVKKIIENNRNTKYRGKTKGGSIILEDSRRRFGVTRKGQLIK